MKVIAFDLFGTVFDLSGVDREEVRAYVHHIHKPEWEPLTLPKSWESLPAHPDSAEGIARLRSRFIVVTCSNGPLGLTAKLCKNAGIQFDAIIPLELNRVYKTNPKAYLTVCEVLDVQPAEVMMVTANKDFGDLEASAKLGMTPQLIRGKSDLPTIHDLADMLGCPDIKVWVPDWIDVDQRIVAGEQISALEKFVHENEPAGDAAYRFRRSLEKALDELQRQKPQEQIT